MKNILSLFFITALLFACSQSNGTYPEDLAGKKALLKVKKAEMAEIKSLVDQLNREIRDLDPSFEKKVSLVTVEPVHQKDFRRYIEIQGIIVSDDVVNVSAETMGRIVALNVKEGQSVRRGQLVAKLDLESLQKQINEIQTSLDLANTVYDRQKRLWDQNIGSEIQYLEAKNNKERLEKSLETLQFQLTKANIYAPISGVIDKEFSKAGEMASPGQPIVQILNTNKVKVVADVPESYLGIIKKRDWVDIHFPALNDSIKAQISQIGRTIDPANRTFKVEVATQNRSGLLKPNLLAEMLVNDLTIKNALVIPLDIVQEEVSGRKYVYVKSNSEEGDIAKKVYLETGESYLSEIVVESGLSGDEQLIIEGAKDLSENALIQIISPSE